MAQPNPLDILNRLYALHFRSLPNYLASAPPWSPTADSPAQTALRHISADQRTMADRIASVITEHGGNVAPAEFPMEFTGLHDLSLEYLIPQIRDRLEREADYIRQSVAQLKDAPAPKAIAEEALGAALAHLDNLKDLQRPTLGIAH